MKKIFFLSFLALLTAASCGKKSEPILNNPNPPEESQATSSPVDVTAGWNQYVSPTKYSFSIKYPSDFGFNTNNSQIQSLGYIPVCDQTTVGCIFYTGNTYTGTNFESAGVSINFNKSLDTEAKCYNFKVSTNEAQTAAADVTINGVTFKSATGGGAGAGHFMKTQEYRNFRNNLCYEITQRVGSTNIGNYEPGTVKEFNENEVWQKLQLIINTFKFSNAVASTGNQVALTGTIVCLPHKNAQPNQPQTMECAIGLKEDSTEKYYSLKNVPNPILDVNVRVKVIGTLLDDSTSKYDTVGAIDVISETKI
jgi:hypothetical protein